MALDLESGEEILLRFNLVLEPKSFETLYLDCCEAWLTHKNLFISTQHAMEKIGFKGLSDLSLGVWEGKKIIQIVGEKKFNVLVVGPPQNKKRTIIDSDTERLFGWMRKLKTADDTKSVINEIKEIQTYFGTESNARNDFEYMLDMCKKTILYVFFFTLIMLFLTSMGNNSLLSSAVFGSTAGAIAIYLVFKKK